MRWTFIALLHPLFDGQSYLWCWHSLPFNGQELRRDEPTLADWLFGHDGRGRGYFRTVSHLRRAESSAHDCSVVTSHSSIRICLYGSAAADVLPQVCLVLYFLIFCIVFRQKFWYFFFSFLQWWRSMFCGFGTALVVRLTARLLQRCIY